MAAGGRDNKALGKAVKGPTGKAEGKKRAEGNTGEEEEKVGEEEIAGALDTPLALKGGDVKQDVAFPASVGELEVEFQAKTARTLTVTENKAPVAPPAGFTALEPSSFEVALAEGGDALTLGQIDFIFDTTKEALKSVDLSTSRIGKLSADATTFVIDDTIGETEFEVDEDEWSLTVTDLNGKWAFLVPQSAVL